MKTFSSIWVGLVISFATAAQSLTPSVTASSGDFFSSSSGSLSWTLGEVMTETYPQSIGYLTQGFQQPLSILVTGITNEKNIFVYPNPAREYLNVNLAEPGDYRIELYDLQGVRVLDAEVKVGIEGATQRYSMQDFRVAMYLLRVTNFSTSKNFVYRIEKI